ncbi:MAG TPA: Hpt domain-containing protein, partial [Verrucomicrobiae bacterium]|nr:Hpt domain-containing protein [Verrucomicrobiae bacterium]
MNLGPQEDLSSLSMLELFRAEAENQTALLTSGLLELERGQPSSHAFEALMRAAHSLKGAARIVNLQSVVRVAHALEDCFVAAQHGRLHLERPQIDVLLQGVDLLSQLARQIDATTGDTTGSPAAVEIYLGLLAKAFDQGATPTNKTLTAIDRTQSHLEPATDKPSESQLASAGPALQPTNDGEVLAPALVDPTQLEIPFQPPLREENQERVVRLTAENLNRLLALAGESLVDSRWLGPFAQSLQRVKRHQMQFEEQLEALRHALERAGLAERTDAYFIELFRQLAEARQFLGDRMQELDLFDRRSAQLSQRLYLEVLRTRMRPFSDGVRRFPRMVRDLARSLGREIRFEILGENTQVDRDILERLEAPLAHLLRNAVDHGCESPEARNAAGK